MLIHGYSKLSFPSLITGYMHTNVLFFRLGQCGHFHSCPRVWELGQAHLDCTIACGADEPFVGKIPLLYSCRLLSVVASLPG